MGRGLSPLQKQMLRLAYQLEQHLPPVLDYRLLSDAEKREYVKPSFYQREVRVVEPRNYCGYGHVGTVLGDPYKNPLFVHYLYGIPFDDDAVAGWFTGQNRAAKSARAAVARAHTRLFERDCFAYYYYLRRDPRSYLERFELMSAGSRLTQTGVDIALQQPEVEAPDLFFVYRTLESFVAYRVVMETLRQEGTVPHFGASFTDEPG